MSDIDEYEKVYCEKCYNLAKNDEDESALTEKSRNVDWAIEYIRKELGIREVFFDNLIKRVVKMATNPQNG
jgi:hypothetical protein